MFDKIPQWIKSIVAVMAAYGLICAIPFVIAPIVGASSAAALGYGPIYEVVAAIISILLVLIWDLRRRQRRANLHNRSNK